MEEMGSSCTSSQAAFKELLDEHGPLDEAAVARIISLIARRHGGKTDIDDSSQVMCLCSNPSQGAAFKTPQNQEPSYVNRSADSNTCTSPITALRCIKC